MFRERVRMAMACFAALSTAGLTELVLRHEPLPLPDARSAALATVTFCLFAIVATLSVQRLPALSFPSLFLAVTFMLPAAR